MRKLPIMSPQPMNLAMQGKLYNPNRDLAYVGITIVRRVLDMMVEDPYLNESIEQGIITEDVVCDIGARLGQFFRICRDDSTIDVYAALESTKLLPEQCGVEERAALAKIFEGIGILVVGSAFNAMRDVNKSGQPPLADSEELVQAAEELTRIFKERHGSTEMGPDLPANGKGDIESKSVPEQTGGSGPGKSDS